MESPSQPKLACVEQWRSIISMITLVHPLLCTSCRGRASLPKLAPGLHIKAPSSGVADRAAAFPSRGNEKFREAFLLAADRLRSK